MADADLQRLRIHGWTEADLAQCTRARRGRRSGTPASCLDPGAAHFQVAASGLRNGAD